MKFDVYADLDHLFMLNFSVDAAALSKLVPAPLTVLDHDGRGLPSIVLPSIKRLRPTLTRFPPVDYEFFGLRILVEYDSQQLGPTKGIYFARLIMDPRGVTRVANAVSPFRFASGSIRKDRGPEETRIEVRAKDGSTELTARVHPTESFPTSIPEGSSFADADAALSMYNDIAYGFLVEDGGATVHVLQIADLHPDYVAWPLTDLDVREAWVASLHDDADLAPSLIREPCYYVGSLPRYWRWLESETPTPK